MRLWCVAQNMIVDSATICVKLNTPYYRTYIDQDTTDDTVLKY
jgi:hypothetical protein